jgi:hypothetical protein
LRIKKLRELPPDPQSFETNLTAAVDTGLTMHMLKSIVENAGRSPAVLVNVCIQPLDSVVTKL